VDVLFSDYNDLILLSHNYSEKLYVSLCVVGLELCECVLSYAWVTWTQQHCHWSVQLVLIL